MKYQGSRGRGYALEIALESIKWLETRQLPFNVTEFGEALEITRRTSFRWLNALEAARLVEIVVAAHGRSPQKWQRVKMRPQDPAGGDDKNPRP